ncbi:hypothetical protein NS228_00900 [Methylobacterium indicum]|uniref:hypothetical protein n=1 Tax=Methylobacterium indicum TaxID=1775910 RepID=UPI000734E002|nr:hypothetical protein [Methylobacterium indicum]KTS38800.1 hypothetical protein NS229_02370 [Methylobacterium indicum]KTS42858.1 hypothetical protein NS228_00900 [Methylobacterium indicum]KTS52985.1 hypothetical protein NS230_08275 [Methylobacterium indicum]
MTFTILPFAPKGAVSVRLPAAPAVPVPKAVLRATWSLDPETGRPVCRWSTDDEGTPARCPVPRLKAA